MEIELRSNGADSLFTLESMQKERGRKPAIRGRLRVKSWSWIELHDNLGRLFLDKWICPVARFPPPSVRRRDESVVIFLHGGSNFMLVHSPRN